jgi:hypothetical protein
MDGRPGVPPAFSASRATGRPSIAVVSKSGVHGPPTTRAIGMQIGNDAPDGRRLLVLANAGEAAIDFQLARVVGAASTARRRPGRAGSRSPPPPHWPERGGGARRARRTFGMQIGNDAPDGRRLLVLANAGEAAIDFQLGTTSARPGRWSVPPAFSASRATGRPSIAVVSKSGVHGRSAAPRKAVAG